MQIVNNTSWGISLIGLSLSVFTLLNIFIKVDKHKTDLLLFGWLVTLNIPLLLTLFAYANLDLHWLNMFINPSVNLLQGPILYTYVQMLISGNGKFKLPYLLHLTPFIFFYFLFVFMPHLVPIPLHNEQSNLMPDVENNSLSLSFKALFGFLNSLIFIGYSIITIILLRKHQKIINKFFSQKNNQISLKWIYSLPLVFIILLFINIANENNNGAFYQTPPMTLHLLSYLFFIILLCFFGMKQKPVFYPDPLTLKKNSLNNQLAKTEEESKPKCASTANMLINESLVSEIIVKMQKYMEINKSYLNPEFSIYHLSEELNIPRRALSHVLNHGLSKNFFQYVNEYRVGEVKRLLENPEEMKSTILDLAFKSGFTSKSSFNGIFKQYCHVTPSQYRKMVRK
ncbi:helix-turn-helix domain-containing protein [Psychromonas algicola]|uniref:helix-turn-helix domain-containing protein n=1 Tax=Psychromonas algicola TaxID=2555642 RepID=UPI001067FC4E|nr:helix-turn-helix domain-containing protein [Psychromonas sp. RZ5]TEW50656.1 AraC family transcriptional regulator [Psychromonas sp. RZ5]